MGVNFRSGDDQHQLSLPLEEAAQVAQDAQLVIVARDVVEGEGSEDQIIGSGWKRVQGVPWNVVAREQVVVAGGVKLPRLADHILGNINSGNLKAEFAQEARGASCAAAEVHTLAAANILGEDGRDVPVR